MAVHALTSNQTYSLKPQAITLFNRLQKVGSLSAREALLDLDMTSATLASRICELEAVGVKFNRVVRKNPGSGRRYTRYVLQGNDPTAVFPDHVRNGASARA